jgi:hypothetical protein
MVDKDKHRDASLRINLRRSKYLTRHSVQLWDGWYMINLDDIRKAAVVVYTISVLVWKDWGKPQTGEAVPQQTYKNQASLEYKTRIPPA